MLIVAVVFGLLAAAVAVLNYIPVQRAIYPEDLGKYDNVIVVKYGGGAPTDCVMIGDSTGMFDRETRRWRDIQLKAPCRPMASQGSNMGVTTI